MLFSKIQKENENESPIYFKLSKYRLIKIASYLVDNVLLNNINEDFIVQFEVNKSFYRKKEIRLKLLEMKAIKNFKNDQE